MCGSDVTSWRLKSLTTQLFIQQLGQASSKENSKDSTTGPLCGAFTKSQYCGRRFHILMFSWMTTRNDHDCYSVAYRRQGPICRLGWQHCHQRLPGKLCGLLGQIIFVFISTHWLWRSLVTSRIYIPGCAPQLPNRTLKWGRQNHSPPMPSWDVNVLVAHVHAKAPTVDFLNDNRYSHSQFPWSNWIFIAYDNKVAYALKLSVLLII